MPSGGSPSSRLGEPAHKCGLCSINEKSRNWLASISCFLVNVFPEANFDKKLSAIAFGSACLKFRDVENCLVAAAQDLQALLSLIAGRVILILVLSLVKRLVFRTV